MADIAYGMRHDEPQDKQTDKKARRQTGIPAKCQPWLGHGVPRSPGGENVCFAFFFSPLLLLFIDSTAKWFKVDQIGKESDGNIWHQQEVSAYHPLSSSSTMTRVKHDTQ